MIERDDMPACRLRPLSILLIMACLIAPVYSNTLHVPWHYDDQPNILANQRLHLTTVNAETIRQTFYAQAGRDRFYRPLSSLSFALNWFWGGDDPFGYHLVNIGIHVLTAFFLYLAVFQLLGTPAVAGRFSGDDTVFIALFAAALWAVNPIQTQAVTYVVQRMAQMAALFYIAGLFFYLKARRSALGRACLYWILTGLMFVFAVFSKENAVMFPVALFLLDCLFFRKTTGSHNRRRHVLWAFVILGVVIAGIVMFWGGDPFRFLRGYHGRPFSFSERVLSEPRIVLFYLSQIFYPLPSRLSVAHDVVLSRSLFVPWTTFFALILTVGLIGAAIKWRRRFPLFAFAVLFYFVNQVVESTIVPLEMIFEHRNYLPSLFLFVPVAAGLRYLMNRYQNRNRQVFTAVLFFVVAIVIVLGRFTYERNRIWQSPQTLWYDAMIKAPGLSGPVNNVAVALGWDDNATPENKSLALALLVRASEMKHPNMKFRARIFDNIGSLAAELGKFGQAEAAYRKAVDLDPNFLKTRQHLVHFLAARGRWDQALTAVDELMTVAGNRAGPGYYETRGFILLWLGRPEEALTDLQQALDKDPLNFPTTLRYTGFALSRLGLYDRAASYYKWSQEGRPLQKMTFFLLIENSARAGDQAAARQYARILFSEFDVYDILTTLKDLPEPGRTVPLDKSTVAPVIKAVYNAIGREAEEKGVLP